MRKQKRGKRQETILYLADEPSEKDVFNEIAAVIKDIFIATFIMEDNSVLRFRFINGRQFRLTIKEVL